MLKLTKVKICKYKCFKSEQEVKIDPHITTLVGKNESGKTAVLEALAKVNYFEKNINFKFNRVADYPRSELNEFLNSNDDKEAVICTFEIDKKLLNVIEDDVGQGVFSSKQFSYGISYKGKTTWYNLKVNEKIFIGNYLKKYDLDQELETHLKNIKTVDELLELWYYSKENENLLFIIEDLKKKYITKSYKWKNKIKAYIAKNYLKPAIPKFWYYDEYYTMPTKININELKNKDIKDETANISRAFFEFANVNIDEILNASDYESFLANLEAAANTVTNKIFKYWTIDKNLEIKFEIENDSENNEKIMNIRVRNTKQRVTLPLRNRSKGFKSFFSFIVWFSKIQSNTDRNFILLLDEPGLNLHASAQADMLNFIEDLSNNYQIIYTTHSPFMVKSEHLSRVRTLSETKEGSIISEVIDEKNPEALFPLQAAIGFDIAQNAFNYKKNFLVENTSDSLFLSTVSDILKSKKKTGLLDDITIIPIGGLDKIAAFTAMTTQRKTNIVCLLSSLNYQKDKQNIKGVIVEKLIKDKNIRFYNEFIPNNDNASIEDIFEKEEYLKLFNACFAEIKDLKLEDLDPKISNITKQIIDAIDKTDFDHYKVAKYFSQLTDNSNFLSMNTLNKFEKMFTEINIMFLNENKFKL